MLASYLPPDVVLTSLTFGKSGVEIGGMSPSETSVARLIANLQGEDSFQNVRVTEIRSGEKDISILSFKIALEFKKEEQKI